MTIETVIAREGDTVDLIAFRRFGAHGMETLIYEANPGLADLGPTLTIGRAVLIPVPGVKDRTTSGRLWD